jgi:hypothetical protein
MPDMNRGPGPKPCAVIISSNSIRCGVSNWGWTNHMEPICLEHFRQRLFLQRWMSMQWGTTWAGLITMNNSQGFLPLEESLDSAQRRNLKHIRKVQDELREARGRGGV